MMTPVASASSGVSPIEEVPPEVAEGNDPVSDGGDHGVAPSTRTAGAGSIARMKAVVREVDHDEEAGQHRDGQVAAGPVDPCAFADPEHAETGQHDADQRLDGVLGHLAELARHQEPDDADEDHGRPRRQGGQAEAVLGRAEADDDQHHLHALEEDAFERHREPDTVAALVRLLPTVPSCIRAELGHRLGVDLVLVVHGLVAAGAQDRLAQPRQAEHQEQRPHDHPQRVDRDVADERDADGHTSTPRTAAATAAPSRADANHGSRLRPRRWSAPRPSRRGSRRRRPGPVRAWRRYAWGPPKITCSRYRTRSESSGIVCGD